MFVLIKNKITGEYNTIYKRDVQEFKNLYNFFKSDPKLPENSTPDFNFEIIEDLGEIKKILEDKFTSKGRGGEYNENAPSCTNIAYNLFPMFISSDKFLLRWKNNTPLKEQEGDKEHILQKGTWCHKILELWVTDKDAREKDKPLITQLKILKNTKKPSKKILKQIDDKIISDIRRYIQIAYKDEEILYKIPNIDDLKEELEFLAVKCLSEFIKNELIFTDLVYSEIFLQTDTIQGSIDLCCYYNNKFSIWDFKTTSSIHKDTGKPKFKTNSTDQLSPYARQLYVYNKLLKENNMHHLIDINETKFNIIQIHLINGKYKKFEISKGLVESQGEVVEKVIKWYWNTRQDIETPDDMPEIDEIDFIDL